MSKANARKVDWQAVERDYRLGTFTLRELGDKYGVNNATILRRAKAGGWTQDLTDAVRVATRAAMVKEAVQQVTQETCSNAQQSAAIAVLAAAEANKDVILRHRTDITKARDITLSLLGELRAMTVHADDLERLLEMAQSEDMTEEQVERMREDFRKLMSMGGRTSSLQKLADTMTKLQALERKAFDLDAPQEEKKGDPMSELMGFLQGGAAKLKPGAQ